MQMKCEHEHCIYNLEDLCVLSEIAINSLGMCDSCVLVDFDKNFLEAEKERQRLKIMDRYSNCE